MNKTKLTFIITAVAIIALAIAAYFKLSPEPNSIFVPSKEDTVRTAITYIDRATGGGRLDIVLKIHKDVEALDSIAPGTLKKTQKRDSIYLVPVWQAVVDSAGKPILDSLGKAVYKPSLQLLDKTLLLEDYNRNY